MRAKWYYIQAFKKRGRKCMTFEERQKKWEELDRIENGRSIYDLSPEEREKWIEIFASIPFEERLPQGNKQLQK